jgi:hypothetical protein
MPVFRCFGVSVFSLENNGGEGLIVAAVSKRAAY